MAKERSNGKFDFSKSNVSRFDFTKDEPDIVDVPLQPGSGSSSDMPSPEKKPNTGKIIGGIAVVAAILACVYFFGIKGDDNVADNDGAPTEQIAQAGKTAQQADITEDAILGEEVASNNDSEATVLVETNEAPVSVGNSNAEEKHAEKPSTNKSHVIKQDQPSQPKQSNTSTTNMASASSPISDDVVENAKRVIRGDFGNGRERKEKLGSAYSEIQSKVNEMYRQGLVH